MVKGQLVSLFFAFKMEFISDPPQEIYGCLKPFCCIVEQKPFLSQHINRVNAMLYLCYPQSSMNIP